MYVDIVTSNVFNLNKHFFFFFLYGPTLHVTAFIYVFQVMYWNVNEINFVYVYYGNKRGKFVKPIKTLNNKTEVQMYETNN